LLQWWYRYIEKQIGFNMKRNSLFLALLCVFGGINARLVPLEKFNVQLQFAREAFGRPVALEIESKLLEHAEFRGNAVLVDEAKALALLDNYFSRLGTQKPMERQKVQPQEQLPMRRTKNVISLAKVMSDVKNMFGPQRQVINEIETTLLAHAQFDQAGNIFVDGDVVTNVINQAVSQKRRAPEVLDIIPLSGSLRQPSLIQLNVNTQKANSCGFHALYNLKALEDLLATNQPITSKGVKEISRMYLDGYLAEIGKQESDLIDLAWEDRPAELSRAAGMKHFFLIQYFNPSHPEVKKGNTSAGPRFAYSGDKNDLYWGEWQIKQAERDFINSVQRNMLTPCILGIPGHYTAFAVAHKPGQRPFIIYMNSISNDGVNSVAMQEGSSEAAVAKYLLGLIATIR